VNPRRCGHASRFLLTSTTRLRVNALRRHHGAVSCARSPEPHCVSFVFFRPEVHVDARCGRGCRGARTLRDVPHPLPGESASRTLACTTYCFTSKLDCGSIKLLSPPPAAKPTLLQYCCTTIAQYTPPPPTPSFYVVHHTILVTAISWICHLVLIHLSIYLARRI